MRGIRWMRFVVGWSLVAGVFFALAPARAADSSFLHEHPTLQFIEQRLPVGVTVAIPPSLDPPCRVVSDLELRAAFSGVLDEFLAPPSTFAGKAADLIGEVCRSRPAQTAQWLALATDALVEYSLPSAEKGLSDAVALAILTNPREAGAVVRAVIGRLAASIQTARLDRETAARIVEKIVFTAMQTAKTLQPAVPLVMDIADQALDEALTHESSDLAVAATAAAVSGSAGVEKAGGVDLARLALSKYGRTKQLAGILCAGALQGAGPEAAGAIKDGAALSLPVAVGAFSSITCNAYVATLGAPDVAAYGTSRFITVANADYIPAVMIGAVAANPRVAVEILQAGLNRDLVLHGRATTREIVEAAVLVSPQSAPMLAAAAVGRGDLQEGNAASLIADGVARGAPSTAIAAALTAQIKAQEMDSATIKATVAGAIAGAVATEKLRALSAIGYAAAANPSFVGDVLDQVIVSAPPERQYCAVLGVLAARPELASALLERALKSSDLAAGQAALITGGGRLILAIQADPAGFFRATLRQLGEAAPASPEMVEAIVLGASLANPRGAPAVASVAVAFAGHSAETIIAAAVQPDPAALTRITESVGTALEVKSCPGDLFRQVQRQIAATPKLAAEVVTGAMAAAPAQGHVIGHAAAWSAPGAIARIVPRLFAFSANGDLQETHVALTRGVINGVLEAELEPATESAAIAEAVAVSVRSVIALTRGRGAAAAEGDAIAAVVAAAARGAEGHTAAVAQVAARTARALSCPAAELSGIKDAVLATGSRVDAAKIADAVAAGIAEADLERPAASAKLLLDYANDSLTGAPMTHFRDL